MMTHTHTPDASNGGISLATVTAGIVAAVLFLLISSYVSADAKWATRSDQAWVTTTLTVDDIAGTVEVVPVTADKHLTSSAEPASTEEGHFFDALYREDFMITSPEPT